VTASSRNLPGVDVRHLPTTVFGARDTAWWGTVGFMAIEATTIVVCVASYFYLWRNSATWPPEHTLRPSLLWPTIAVIVMLVSNIPMVWLRRAAKRLDLAGVRRWLIVGTVLSAVFVVLRWQEFLALNTRWDTNAYGSIAWLSVGFHATLLIANLGETAVMTAMLHSSRRTERHYTDAVDGADYWHFMTGIWVPLYVIIYLGPYFL